MYVDRIELLKMNFKNNTNNKRVAIPSKFCCNQSTSNLTIPNATIAKTNDKTENNNFESKSLNQNLTTPVQKLNAQQAKPTSFNKQIKETNETNGQNKLSVTCLNKSKTISNSENQEPISSATDMFNDFERKRRILSSLNQEQLKKY